MVSVLSGTESNFGTFTEGRREKNKFFFEEAKGRREKKKTCFLRRPKVESSKVRLWPREN